MQQMAASTGRSTIYDVADAAGTSASTASRALRGSSLVAARTRRAVELAARRLGYASPRRRRPAGRSILNVVVFLPHAREPQAHLFYDVAELFTGLREGFGNVRAHTIAALGDGVEPLEARKIGDVDGCIFAFGTPTEAVRAELSGRRIPTVLINRFDRSFACVANDAHAGMTLLAQQVARRRTGDRTAFVTLSQARPVAVWRERALLASAPPGFCGPPDVVRFASPSRITTAAVGGLLDAGYRTFMCVNDLAAVAVYERLLSLGVRVPLEAGLTGYDASPVRRLVSVDLTTVDLAVREQGRGAARILAEAIIERRLPVGHHPVAGTLIRGASL